MTNIIADLKDLKKQATTERSHHYVAACCDRAIDEIESLQLTVLGEREINGRHVKRLQAALEIARTALLNIEHRSEEGRAALTLVLGKAEQT